MSPEMIKAVPDLLATRYMADLGNQTQRTPRRRRLSVGHELLADQVVEGGEDAVLNADTASRHCAFQLELVPATVPWR
jgi:hypothetical protein